jgi:hypothetical protein
LDINMMIGLVCHIYFVVAFASPYSLAPASRLQP